MYREAEKQFKSALKHQEFVDIYLYLSKVYTRLDQPLTAIEVFKQGLEKFPQEASLLTGIARIYEVSLEIEQCQLYFKGSFMYCICFLHSLTRN